MSAQVKTQFVEFMYDVLNAYSTIIISLLWFMRNFKVSLKIKGNIYNEEL